MAPGTLLKLSRTPFSGDSPRPDVCGVRAAARVLRLGQNRTDFFADQGVHAAV
jgi:hypothetical protein